MDAGDGDQVLRHGYSHKRPGTIQYRTLDDADLESQCPLDNGRRRTQPFPGDSDRPSTLGLLESFPLEIIQAVLIRLSVPSLTTFRRVNRRAIVLVDSLPRYRVLWDHCPNVLRAIVSLDAQSYDCRTLFATLSTSKCNTCGQFGDYLYVITCQRTCYFCLRLRFGYPLLSAKPASLASGLSEEELVARAPRVHTLTGRFGYKNSSPFTERTWLYDGASVRALSAGREWTVVDPETWQTRVPRLHMVVISAPFFDHSPPSGRLVDWGVYCLVCKDGAYEEIATYQKYAQSAFPDHIREFGAVAAGEDASRVKHTRLPDFKDLLCRLMLAGPSSSART
jgi:hypothetical protein